MYKVFLWIIFFIALYFAYQAGWFHNIANYFSESEKFGRQERVIEEEDGSITTVRYRNVFDIVTGKFF